MTLKGHYALCFKTCAMLLQLKLRFLATVYPGQIEGEGGDLNRATNINEA